MPITKAAKKALRQSKRKRIRNLQKIKNLKNILKEAKILILEKKTAEAKKILPRVYKILDKAAKSGLIKKNTADRNKSRITKSIFRTAAKSQ